MPNLPAYIEKSVPNPASNRAPWYKNTAPSYAGVFLWIAFYQSLAVGTLNHAGPFFCILALVVAGILSYALFYYAPGMLGMKTGYPLYVIGSSTFGTAGGYIMPGLLMGLLQIGWFAVATYFAASYILQGFGKVPHPGTLLFGVVAVLWGLIMGYIGAKGIQYVAKVALTFTIIPALMVLYVFFKTAGGLSAYHVAAPNPLLALAVMLQTVLGFFATAGAAGADFGMNNRDGRDVKLGGLFGVALSIVFAGGLPILAVAGANGLHPGVGFGYDSVIGSIGGFGASAMFILFALASIVPTCFCIFIAGNSFATMIPSIPRISSSFVAVFIGLILAVTGVAANLTAVFSLVGASFGPICGAILADYLLAGGKWAGPRRGINWAGYSAWAIGFVIGILPLIGSVPASIKAYDQPAALYSMIAGFVIYALVAKAGGQPQTISLDLAKAEPAKAV
jgi:cytosine permease